MEKIDSGNLFSGFLDAVRGWWSIWKWERTLHFFLSVKKRLATCTVSLWLWGFSSTTGWPASVFMWPHLHNAGSVGFLSLKVPFMDCSLFFIMQILVKLYHTSLPKESTFIRVPLDLFIYLFLNFFSLFGATPMPHGGSQDRGPIGAAAARRHYSHSNAGSFTHWARPGVEPKSSWFLVGFASVTPRRGRLFWILIANCCWAALAFLWIWICVLCMSAGVGIRTPSPCLFHVRVSNPFSVYLVVGLESCMARVFRGIVAVRCSSVGSVAGLWHGL